MVDMEMSKEEIKETLVATPSEGPRYPYGLKITLDQEQLEKLGITDLPSVGDYATISAKCEVCHVSENQYEDGQTSKSLSLQITDLAVGGLSEEEIYD